MLVNTSEAAELAGVSADLVRQWKRRGLLRQAGRWGRHPLYDPVEVLQVERATRTGIVARSTDLVSHSLVTQCAPAA